MKTIGLFLFIVAFSALVVSCKKDAPITSMDALFSLSSDTLHFDTVFSTVGSITQQFIMYNPNNRPLVLSSVSLAGGASSAFKLNVDGSAGNSFQNITIAANDSLYGFVTVTINPNSANLPFIVRDSIKIIYNGNIQYLQLNAYCQNAHFLNNAHITKDTTWASGLPFVITGGLTVDKGATLHLTKGVNVYFHADAGFQVNGSIQAIGDKYDSTRINFLADRLDNPYKYYPGSWPGISFGDSSKNNLMQFCNIEYAYQGIALQSLPNDGSIKILLQECKIDNMYDAAIIASNSSLSATNCLISNSGYGVSIQGGGNYSFYHCTIACYGNTYLAHKNPVLAITNANSLGLTNPLNCSFVNSILYGDGGTVNDEVSITKQTTSSTFNITFDHILYKSQDFVSNATFTNYLLNQPPLFDSLDGGNVYYDFHLMTGSPCIDYGILIPGLNIDLDGNNRVVGPLPDLGCYEKQ